MRLSRLNFAHTAPLTRLMTALVVVYPAISIAQNTPVSNSQQVEEVVVTASRINREGFTAPTPTTVVGAEEIKARAATTINDILYDLPSVTPSTTTVGVSGAGQSAPNLRNLNGSTPPNTRSLFLVNGIRYVPTNQYGQTDSNVVPSSLIQTIETVTGGASAAWGSDAIAGVINIVLRKRLDGFEGNIQYGQSQRNDNKTNQAALAWGTEFAGGRGQFMIAGEYSRLYSTPTYGDRAWSSQRTAFITKTENGVTYTNYPASGLNVLTLAPGGVIINASTNNLNAGTALYTNAGPATAANLTPFLGVQFGAGGVPQPFTYTTDTSFRNGTYGVGGSGAWPENQVNISVPLTRKNVYARATFDLTENVSAFADFGHAESFNAVNGFPIAQSSTSGAGVIAISRNNPYLQQLTGVLPTSGQTLYNTMVANGIQTITLGRISPDLGTYSTSSRTKVNNFSLGLEGVFGESGKWKANAANGKSTNQVYGYSNIITRNFFAALDPIVVNGQIVCNPTVIANLGANPVGCVPINPFGAGSVNQAALNYVTGTYSQYNVNKRKSANLSVQGEPFSNWAGPVSLAGGVEWHRDYYSFTTDAISNLPTQALNTGDTYPIGGVNGYANVNAKTTPLVAATTKELFAETVVPLLSKMAFVKSLDLNAAYRRTDYSTTGVVNSWKAGLTWVPVSDFLLRGTRSHDIRSPNLFELYSNGGVTGQTTATGTQSGADPLNSATGYSYAGINQGNADLQPEKAETTTYGITFTPTAVKGLSASIDVWKIKLKNATGQLSTPLIIDACYGRVSFAAAGPDPTYCQYITRASNGLISTVQNRYFNLALRRTQGFDVELAYRFALNRVFADAPGTLDLRALGSFLNDDVITSTSVATPIDYAGTASNGPGGNGLNPHWRWTLSATYQNGPLTFNLQGKFIQDMVYTNLPVSPTQYYSNSVPSRFYVNTSAQYTLYDKPGKGRLQLYGNINNLFDKDPPLIYATGNTPAPTALNGLYDGIGRAFVLGLRFAY